MGFLTALKLRGMRGLRPWNFFSPTTIPLMILKRQSLKMHWRFPSSTFFLATGKLANVIAVKMPLAADGDYAGEMQRLRAMTPEDFAIGYSGDWGAKDALLAGGACWYSVVAGLLPEPAFALTRAAQAGNAAEAERIDHAFAPLWALFREFGSFRLMFAIAESLGFGPITPPRPILALEPAYRERVELALRPLLQLAD